MMQVDVDDTGFTVDAGVIAEAFRIAETEVRKLMHSGEIRARCEKGVDEDTGRWRLIFFHNSRALRLTVDESGKILGRARYDVPR